LNSEATVNRNFYLLAFGLVGTTWLAGCASQRPARHKADIAAVATKETETDAGPRWSIPGAKRTTTAKVASRTKSAAGEPVPVAKEVNDKAPSTKVPTTVERSPLLPTPSPLVDKAKPNPLPDVPASRSIKPDKTVAPVETPPAEKATERSPAPPPLIPSTSRAPATLPEPIRQVQSTREAPLSPPSAPTKTLDELLREAEQHAARTAAQERATTQATLEAPVVTPITSAEESLTAHATLTGEVQLWRRTWRLRYAPADSVDAHGGSVVLAGGRELAELRDGQRIRVRGMLVPNVDGQTPPVYQVQALEVLEKR
jgi:hypothetical protein